MNTPKNKILCKSCSKVIPDKAPRAWTIVRGYKLTFCWECNSAGKVEECLDKLEESNYNRLAVNAQEFSNYS